MPPMVTIALHIYSFIYKLIVVLFAAQRVRRTSRSREDDPQRRQRQRQVRSVIIGSVRPSSNSTRPAIDLPLGYGSIFVLLIRENKFEIILEMRTTQQGQVYFYHIPTGVSTWHDPRIPRDFDLNSLSPEQLGTLPRYLYLSFLVLFKIISPFIVGGNKEKQHLEETTTLITIIGQHNLLIRLV